MRHPKTNPATSLIEHLLGEASWFLSHAQALNDYGRSEEAAAERARAATCEEQVAGLLDANGQEREAAIHRVSSASCYEKLGRYTLAVTLLRAALSVELTADYRARIEQQLARCLRQVPKELRETSRRESPKSPSAAP